MVRTKATILKILIATVGCVLATALIVVLMNSRRWRFESALDRLAHVEGVSYRYYGGTPVPLDAAEISAMIEALRESGPVRLGSQRRLAQHLIVEFDDRSEELWVVSDGGDLAAIYVDGVMFESGDIQKIIAGVQARSGIVER